MANKKEQASLFEPIVAPKRNFEIIEASIRREIYNGALVPGQKLPNEFEPTSLNWRASSTWADRQYARR